MKQTLFKIAVGIGLLSLLHCNGHAAHHAKQQFFRMATLVEVTVVSEKDNSRMQPLWNSIDSLLAYWEDHYSQTNPRSDILRLNNRRLAAVPVSTELGAMVAEALAYGDSSKGMFDISIYPIKELWGLGEKDTVHRVPGLDTLASVLKHVDYHKIRVSQGRDTIFFADPDTRIDAGGFAKGYALMSVALFLDRRGWGNYLVAAGDIVGKGMRSDGAPWVIGIQHPRKEGLLATVPFDSGAIFTWGDYQEFLDGRQSPHPSYIQPENRLFLHRQPECHHQESLHHSVEIPFNRPFLPAGGFYSFLYGTSRARLHCC